MINHTILTDAVVVPIHVAVHACVCVCMYIVIVKYFLVFERFLAPCLIELKNVLLLTVLNVFM